MAEAVELGDLGKAQKTTRAGVTMARRRDREEDCRDEASPRTHGGNKSQDEASPRTNGGNKSQNHRGTAACRGNMAGRRTAGGEYKDAKGNTWREIKSIRGGGRKIAEWVNVTEQGE